MKAILFGLIVITATFKPHNAQLSQAQQEKAKQYTAECFKTSGAKPEVVIEAKKGNFQNDETLKKFILCFFQNAGVLSSDAKLNVEVTLFKMPPGIDKVLAEKVLVDCKNKKGKDNADTAYEMAKCFHQGTKQSVFFDS